MILSQTKRARDTIFVGDKDDTLNALVELLLHRTQWTDYMENVLNIVDINTNNDGIAREPRVLDQQTYPFRIADISVPEDSTGYVYMIVSLQTLSNFYYIGKTKKLIKRLRAHNSGYGSSSTIPTNLRPYGLFAYICGFDQNEILMFSVENQWKVRRDVLICQRILDPKSWARAGQDIIISRRNNNDGFQDLHDNSGLRLVMLCRVLNY